VPDYTQDPLDGLEPVFSALRNVNATLVEVRHEVDVLASRVEYLEEIPEQQRIHGAPVAWHLLTDETRGELWPAFIAWVTWLADTYELSTGQLPRCWHHHGAAVAELTDLWTSWRSAHEANDDAGSAPYLWGDALARALDRLAQLWLGVCTTGEHERRYRQTWGDDAAYLDAMSRAGPPHPTAPTTTGGTR
jgi:hypothetical protein